MGDQLRAEAVLLVQGSPGPVDPPSPFDRCIGTELVAVQATMAYKGRVRHGTLGDEADCEDQVMRYFTKELWGCGNASSIAIAKQAALDWDANLEAYRRQLTRLLPRLPKGAAAFFTKHSLHDGTLISASIGDAVDQPIERTAAPQTPRRTTVVLVALSGAQPGHLYRLSYGRVKAFEVRPDSSLFPVYGSLFGDWGYDELLPGPRGYLRHNILFQTGTEISVVFRDFRFARQRVGQHSTRSKR